MTKPPAVVSLATSAQVPPDGGFAVVTMILSSAAAVDPAPSSLFLLHAASARAAMLQTSRVPTFIQMLRLIAGIGSSSSGDTDGGPLLAAICAASDSRQWRSSG